MMNKMLAPRLRHRITIEQPSQTRDEFGGVIDGWAVVAQNVPAEVMAMTGREYLAARAMQAATMTTFVIRQSPKVTQTMRILFNGEVYAVKAVLPDSTFMRYQKIMCETGPNATGV